MSEAIQVLRHDHDAILMALRILDRMAEQARGGTLSQADANGFIDFLREFADKCHHGKEEGLLFPALIEAGMPEQGGPVSVMLHEHEQGRELVAAMDRASTGVIDARAFAQAAAAYVEHMRAHIAKENDVLFPMADRILGSAVLDRLNEDFERHEEVVIGHGRHEQLHAMLGELKGRYHS